VRLQGSEESIDPFEQAIVDNPLVLVGFNLVLSFESLLMDLILLCADEGALVDVGVDFNVRVVAQFESVLVLSALRFSLVVWGRGKISSM
jgi:hypothetical protein